MTTAKIFIDPNEDIVFTYAKIINADSQYVILLVPAGSNISNSQVSLKLLSRMLQKTDKLVALVVEDELSMRFASKANLVAVAKVSDVNSDTWFDIQKTKEAGIAGKKEHQEQLLAERSPAEPVALMAPSLNEEESTDTSEGQYQEDSYQQEQLDESVEDQSEQFDQENQELLSEIKRHETQDIIETSHDDPIADALDPDTAAGVGQEVIASSEESTEMLAGEPEKVYLGDFSMPEIAPMVELQEVEAEGVQSEDQTEVLEPPPLFTKLEPKLMDLGGYAILAGGDVAVDNLGKVVKGKLAAIERFHEYDDETENSNLTEQKAEEVSPIAQEAADFDQENGSVDAVGSDDQSANEVEDSDFRKRTATAASKLLASTRHWIDTQRQKLSQSKQPKFSEASSPDSGQNIQPDVSSGEVEHTESKDKSTNRIGLTNHNFAHMRYDFHNQAESTPRMPRNYARSTQRSAQSDQVNTFSRTAPRVNRGGTPVTSVIRGLQGQLKDLVDKGKSIVGRNKMRAAVIVILPLLALFLLSSTVFASAQVKVTLAQKSLPIQGEVKASQEVTDLDITNLTIPMRSISKSASSSQTVKATGTGEKGTKATGVVSAVTIADTPITLEAGTVLSLNGKNNIDYKLLAPINLTTEKKFVEGIKIEAVKFGQEYNQLDGSQKKFTVKDKQISNLSIFTTGQISGGEKQETTVVSQQDIDAAAADVTNLLKRDLETEINALISTSEVKLGDKVTFGEAQISSNKPVNTEVEEFDVTVNLTAEALVVNKSDLLQAAKALTSQDQQVQGEFKVNEVQLPEIKEIKIAGKEATFTVNTAAAVTPDLTVEEIKTRVLGLSSEEARGAISSMPDIKDVKVEISPSYLPGFLRRVPSDANKVDVQVK